MLDQYLIYLDPRRWEETTYWVVGLLGAGFLFIIVPWLWRRRPTPTPRTVSVIGAAPSGAPNPSASQSSGPPTENSSVYHERRASQRRKGNPIEVLLSDAAATAQPLRGQVVDRSLGGLRIAMDQPLDIGGRFSVRPSAAPANVAWVQVEVKHKVQREDHWEVGCAFVERPPLSVVLLFG